MNYSDKNVLMLSKYDYKIYFISKMEKPVKRMRWKTIEFSRKTHSSKKWYSVSNQEITRPS